ncbi:hypothetical protein BS17DRAFT_387343 [Gyrodon lividus]|nr:hypothetical protein BS17DRAFT_387343 [Gyrodon lividus]
MSPCFSAGLHSFHSSLSAATTSFLMQLSCTESANTCRRSTSATRNAPIVRMEQSHPSRRQFVNRGLFLFATTAPQPLNTCCQRYSRWCLPRHLGALSLDKSTIRLLFLSR